MALELGAKYAAMEATVGHSRRQCSAVGICDGYTRSCWRYTTSVDVETTLLTPARGMNSSPPNAFDHPRTPPGDEKYDAGTDCSTSNVRVSHWLWPHSTMPLTLKA